MHKVKLIIVAVVVKKPEKKAVTQWNGEGPCDIIV